MSSSLSSLFSSFHLPTALATTAVIVGSGVVYNLYHQYAIKSQSVSLPPPSTTPPAPSKSLSDSAIRSLLDFFLTVGGLKTVRRSGWIAHNVPLPESVSDHMYRMAVMAFTLTQYETGSAAQSPYKVAVLALVHDMAESIVGDITPEQYSGVSKADKRQMEARALNQIASTLRVFSDEHADDITAMFNAYEHGTDATSSLLHDVDKLEMIVQAFEYEQTARTDTSSSVSSQLPLDRFFESRHGIKDTRVKQIAEEIMRRRTLPLTKAPKPTIFTQTSIT